MPVASKTKGAMGWFRTGLGFWLSVSVVIAAVFILAGLIIRYAVELSGGPEMPPSHVVSVVQDHIVNSPLDDNEKQAGEYTSKGGIWYSDYIGGQKWIVELLMGSGNSTVYRWAVGLDGRPGVNVSFLGAYTESLLQFKHNIQIVLE